MRILVHDYCGHPFQVQLSRALAKRNHQVLHIYSGSFQTPHGNLKKVAADPENFNCLPIYLSKPFAKYSFLKRRFQEVEYGNLLNEEAGKFDPDVIISANAPLDVQNILLKRQKRKGVKFIFWVQDLVGIAINNHLIKKYYLVGNLIGAYYKRLEFNLLRRSDQIIVITEDFLPILEQPNIQKERIHVIHNWAPLEELPLQSKDNDWARKYGLHDKLCFLYSGTLSLKHNPQLILRLATNLKNRNDIKIVILSEGPGADFLREKKKELKLHNLMLFGFQPFEMLPQVHGAADILMAILEKDAGIFSVPSKVLTYHCAGRALLLAVPANNLAAQIVQENETGMIVGSDNFQGFLEAADKLLQDDELRQHYGRNARNYAETLFDAEKVTDKFIRVINS
jgi:glycosyltransferase involved in cell wall biosynthesis